MEGFEPVTLRWGGKDFVVPANKTLMLIARIEDALGGANGDQAIDVLLNRAGGPPHSRMAAAFGAALRYAGAMVTDEEIYLDMHRDIAAGERDQIAVKVNMMVLGLLSIISPPTSKALARATQEPAEKKD